MKDKTVSNFSTFRVMAYWLIVVIYGVGIFVLSSMSFTFHSPRSFPQMDKLIHAVEFGLFSFLLFQAIQVTFLRTPVLYLIFITAFVSILYGVLDEYHQFFTPLRRADLFDLLADAIGILIAQGVIMGRLKFFQIASNMK